MGEMYAQFVQFLTNNLEYILIGIAVLIVLFIIALMIPGKRSKKGQKEPSSFEEARQYFEDALSSLKASMDTHQTAVEGLHKELRTKRQELEDVEEVIALRALALQHLNQSIPEDVQAAVDRMAPRTTRKRSNGWGKFFLGTLLGLLLGIGGYYAYINQAQLMDMVK